MKLQFDHYRDAISVMHRAVAECYLSACEISGMAVPDSGWPMDGQLDHRAIQDAHDTVAAVWRNSVERPEPSFDFAMTHQIMRSDLVGWLDWLRAEIRTLAMERPDLIALFVRICQNQNTDPGYEAEKRLRGCLRGHYSQVQWLDN